ncbi:hypothetical protein KAR91_81020 [Candidatus Pacearchaeota archaeon]|nr:hypothetical protein [Candidatus Pacearchaeota archaeon]
MLNLDKPRPKKYKHWDLNVGGIPIGKIEETWDPFRAKVICEARKPGDDEDKRFWTYYEAEEYLLGNAKPEMRKFLETIESERD